MQEHTQLIRPAQVCEKLAISSTTLWRLVKENKLQPIKITQRNTAFKLSDIEKYIQQRMEVGHE